MLLLMVVFKNTKMITGEASFLVCFLLQQTRFVHSSCTAQKGCRVAEYCDVTTGKCLSLCGEALEHNCAIDEYCDVSAQRCQHHCRNLCGEGEFCDTQTALCEECNSICNRFMVDEYADCKLYCPDFYKKMSSFSMEKPSHPSDRSHPGEALLLTLSAVLLLAWCTFIGCLVIRTWGRQNAHACDWHRVPDGPPVYDVQHDTHTKDPNGTILVVS